MRFSNIVPNLVAALAAIALLAAAPAAAIVKIATYTGLIDNGSDLTGLFGGAPGGDLAGLNYSVSYRYQLLPGNHNLTPTDDTIVGGFITGLPAAVSARLTINGFTKAFSGNAYSSATTGDNYTAHFAIGVFSTASGYGQSGVVNTSLDLLPGDLSIDVAPTAIVLDDGDGGDFSSKFEFRVDDIDGNILIATSGDFAADAVYSVTTGVPEPTAWMLMIGGFGLVGTALRRKGYAIA